MTPGIGTDGFGTIGRKGLGVFSVGCTGSLAGLGVVVAGGGVVGVGGVPCAWMASGTNNPPRMKKSADSEPITETKERARDIRLAARSVVDELSHEVGEFLGADKSADHMRADEQGRTFIDPGRLCEGYLCP